MPAWLVDPLIGILVNFGIPLFTNWLKTKFPTAFGSSPVVNALSEFHLAKQAPKAIAVDKLKTCLGGTCPS